LDITRFEVYEGYLDEELDHQHSQATASAEGYAFPTTVGRDPPSAARWPTTLPGDRSEV
jgi:hypothetical protein